MLAGEDVVDVRGDAPERSPVVACAQIVEDPPDRPPHERVVHGAAG